MFCLQCGNPANPSRIMIDEAKVEKEMSLAHLILFAGQIYKQN